MKLARKQIDARLVDMPGWAVRDDALVRQYTFESFPDAVAFVVRLAFDAEARDHHPDLLVSYKRVTVTWTTHSDGGVTDKDLVGAEQIGRDGGGADPDALSRACRDPVLTRCVSRRATAPARSRPSRG